MKNHAAAESTHEYDRRIRILFVDDEVEFVNVLSKRLARRGIDVTPESSGSRGIRALRMHHFDLAVIELKMGDMEGIDVLKIFKKMDPRMPVIMLTGHGFEALSRESIIKSGACDYLRKPCDLSELIEKIRIACGGGGNGIE